MRAGTPGAGSDIGVAPLTTNPEASPRHERDPPGKLSEMVDVRVAPLTEPPTE
jgi:hypothetical protein